MANRWWPRRERLEWELQALSDAGYDYELISGAPAEPDELHVRVFFDCEGHEIQLDVHFPELYPYFRFTVDAPDLSLAHHQNPFHKNLCLIGRGTDRWRLKDTLVGFLQTQIPLAMDLGSDQTISAGEAARSEQVQAEPVSDYYPYGSNHLLVMDGSWALPPEVPGGTMTIGFETKLDFTKVPFRAFVLEIHGPDGTILAEADRRIRERVKDTREARWLQLSEPLIGLKPDEFAKQFRRLHDRLQGGKRQAADGGSFEVLTSVFPEERGHRDGRSGAGWVSVLSWRPKPQRVPGQGKRKGIERCVYLRTIRGGPSDYLARVPEVAFLQDSKVSLVGLGCIGSVVAMELAQAGVGQLHVVDSDFVDPAASVRWPLGATVYGIDKVHAIRSFLQYNYPFTTVSTHQWRLGTTKRAPGSQEWEVVEELVDGSDLIIDATAEHGVQRFLSELCRRHGIPYVWVWGTRGGLGGLIGVIDPDEGPCWACVEMAMASEAELVPREDPAAEFQAAGCGDPTFTGAGFDMHTLSAAATRTAVSALASREGHYPAECPTVQVFNFRDPLGKRIELSWSAPEVEKRASCPVCAGD